MKKGMSAVFQYMLVAIVGAIILFFFIRFAMQSTESFGTLNSAYIAATLKDSFTSLSVSQYSSTKFPTRGWSEDTIFNIGGRANCGRISVDNTNYIEVDKIIYGPDSLEGRQFNVWTRVWKYPYKVTNFFYVNNKDTKYFLVYNSDSIAFVSEIDSVATDSDPIDHIPKTFDVKAVASDKINENYVSSYSTSNDFVKFVFFDVEPTIKKRQNVEVMQIKDFECVNEYDCVGDVYFGNEKRKFYGKAMLYGAIFAGDLDNYDCNYDRAMQNFDAISWIYYNKAKLLKAKNNCDYDGIFNNIENVNMDTFSINMMNLNKEFTGECKSVF